MDSQWRVYVPYHSPNDPCRPRPHAYIVPPNQFVIVQPKGLKQWSAYDALSKGVLWPELYSPYEKSTVR